jgi:hypothetical protein
MVSATLISRYKKWIPDVLINHFSSSVKDATEDTMLDTEEAEEGNTQVGDTQAEYTGATTPEKAMKCVREACVIFC